MLVGPAAAVQIKVVGHMEVLLVYAVPAWKGYAHLSFLRDC